MADLPIFPASIGEPEMSSMGWAPLLDNIVRSQMDGAVRFRRRFTLTPQVFSCSLYVSPAQLETLEDFHRLTVGEVGRFSWFDYRRPSNVRDLAVYSFNTAPVPQNWEDIFKVQLSLVMWSGVFGRNPLSDESGRVLTTQDVRLTT